MIKQTIIRRPFLIARSEKNSTQNFKPDTNAMYCIILEYSVFSLNKRSSASGGMFCSTGTASMICSGQY